MTPARYCSDNCRKRAHEEEVVGSCPGCGRPRTRSDVRRYERCQSCDNARRRRDLLEHAREVSAHWIAGESLEQIADRYGITAGAMGAFIHKVRKIAPEMFPHRYRVSERGVRVSDQSAR